MKKIVAFHREKPLALYVMSNSNETVKLFQTKTFSGGFCSNDLLTHYAGIHSIYIKKFG